MINVDPTGHWCESTDGNWAHPGGCSSSDSIESDDMLHHGDNIKGNGDILGQYEYPFELRYGRWYFGDEQAYLSADATTQEKMWNHAKSQWVNEVGEMAIAISGPLDTGITIAGAFTGGSGNAAYFISKEATKSITKKFGAKGIEVFTKAAGKGMVGATGQSGIKRLTGSITKNGRQYNYEIKVKTKEHGDYRVYGYRDTNGQLIFDYFDKALH